MIDRLFQLVKHLHKHRLHYPVSQSELFRTKKKHIFFAFFKGKFLAIFWHSNGNFPEGAGPGELKCHRISSVVDVSRQKLRIRVILHPYLLYVFNFSWNQILALDFFKWLVQFVVGYYYLLTQTFVYYLILLE